MDHGSPGFLYVMRAFSDGDTYPHLGLWLWVDELVSDLALKNDADRSVFVDCGIYCKSSCAGEEGWSDCAAGR